MVSKQEHVEQLILDTAAKLFEKYGYNNVRISDITKDIGMTTGFFYYHFRSKEQILQMIYENYISGAAEAVREIYEMGNLSAEEKLNLLIKRHCKGIRDNHAHVSVFFREYRNLSEEAIKIIQEKNSDYLKHIVKIIEQGVEEGLFKEDVNPKMVSLAIIGMCNWIYQWFKEGGGKSIDEVGETFYRLVTSGLLK
ncbi:MULTISPECIES: TetR/AcrR family transcriptional regulator [unclassified Paenibacillus]|uniref:TetR/AcrR family transcriptional regulator n=1 Tax=unclassified Paenibacillus TaxID=185978 RepID=UPI001AE16893|nr:MULTISPECIES: TetR/AcrR family transcriptional regulator [unclassified Paenibacillus]MBP1155358.1 AcrR family transcriptional regulator [Paenibacillus sp. PvP091]MBP1169258.1 AcrR family transcriptional regulator [Paenibacillus sp. PvR098]MBP2440285.1 AcrR family transcriptional regulator [Paenibacillus sp. PvP052]